MKESESLLQLRDQIRAAASDRAWSQGVTLAREDRVSGVGSSQGEIELHVRVPGKPAPLVVVLNLAYGEWECDCTTRDTACSHVAAAIITLCALPPSENGPTLPVSRTAGGTLHYRFSPAAGGVELVRVVVSRGGRERVVKGSVLSPQAEPIATTEVDITVDQLLLAKSTVLSAERLERVLQVLADAPHVRWGNDDVTCSRDPVLPTAIIDDVGPAVRVSIDVPGEVTAVVAPGIARCGDVLRPMGAVELTGMRYEKLPQRQVFASHEWPELLAQRIPELARRIPLELRTARLPKLGTKIPPRIDLEIMQRGDTLSVLPTLVYGEPAAARVDGNRLVHLQGPLPIRDLSSEKQLLWRLRDELNMVPGRRIEMSGRDAFQLNIAVARWIRSDAASARAVSVALDAHMAVSGSSLDIEFSSGERRADPEAVVRAWVAGTDVVPLLGGGWGLLPKEWLDRHGHRLADLLAVRGGDKKLPAYALPDLARLCVELEQPPPPDLEAIRPLIEGFVGVPRAQLPQHLDRILRPYQRLGVNWLVFARDAGLGAVLADDMGLGKTVQAICAMTGRTLVVSPTSVLFNWADELTKFRPELRVGRYHGPGRSLDPTADVILTTYPLLRNDADKLSAETWDVVILDESQAIKNPDSQVARAAYGLKARWRVTLSGTPVENRLEELWSHFHFVNPGLLGGRLDFRDRFGEPIANGNTPAAARLRERIAPFILRRLKRDVAPELPPRTEAILHVELDDRERAIYDTIRAATQSDLVAMLRQGGSVMAALEALLRLRQAACHWALVPGQKLPTKNPTPASAPSDESSDEDAEGTGRDGAAGGQDSARPQDRPVMSSKVARLVAALDDAIAEGHKSLVFSQWTSLLDLIEPHLRARGHKFVRLDGSTQDRAGVVARFQAEDGPPVMLLSLKAGGTGLNLTAADHVFLCDPWWNPAVEDQAADRAHRIGQDKPVFVYRLVARDTVEDKILVLQQRKRGLVDAALSDAQRAASLTREDLLALLE